MKRNLWIVIGVVAAVIVVAIWLFMRSGGDHVAIDLMREFPNAKAKRPSPDIFSVVDAKLGTDTKPAIFTKDPSRIIWSVTVPNNAWLKVSVGLKEEAWTQPGNGVLFQVGISDGKNYQELMAVDVNPSANASDRRWQDLMLDISQWAGQTVDVIFNTYANAPGQPVDTANDLALWGAPQIVVR